LRLLKAVSLISPLEREEYFFVNVHIEVQELTHIFSLVELIDNLIQIIVGSNLLSASKAIDHAINEALVLVLLG
jgi:hypothetical protein